jgi:hypothetical protein
MERIVNAKRLLVVIRSERGLTVTKPEMDLTLEERKRVKTVAKQLLETLKREKLVLDWRRN